jgi:proline dehydrogenase
LLYLSTAVWARQWISSLSIAKRVAGRFVAGETRDDAINTARALNQKGMLVTMDYLGESVTTADEAIAARDEILHLLDCIHESGVRSNVSVKLSQLGLKIDTHLALNNTRTILTRARQYQNKIRLDMEESALVDATLDLYRTLHDEDGFDNVGVVMQAYLYRTERDVCQLIDEGAWVRLCKGAYAEPPEVAFPAKADTDANFIKLMQQLLSQEARRNGVYLGVATHDEKMIAATMAYVQSEDIGVDEFEFQMLFGIRRELQERIVAQGYQMRIYVPYGTAWYPYFVRRLAERPANLWFFMSNFFRA